MEEKNKNSKKEKIKNIFIKILKIVAIIYLFFAVIGLLINSFSCNASAESNSDIYNLGDYDVIRTVGEYTYVDRYDVNYYNLLNIYDVDTTSINGISYSINNGIITLNGTCTSQLDIILSNSIINYNSLTVSLWFEFTEISKSFSLLTRDNLNEQKNHIDIHDASPLYRYRNNQTYDSYCKECFIRIYTDTTLNNVVLKPMITYGTTLPLLFNSFDPLNIYTGSSLSYRGDFIKTDVYNITGELHNKFSLDIDTNNVDIDYLGYKMVFDTSTSPFYLHYEGSMFQFLHYEDVSSVMTSDYIHYAKLSESLKFTNMSFNLFDEEKNVIKLSTFSNYLDIFLCEEKDITNSSIKINEGGYYKNSELNEYMYVAFSFKRGFTLESKKCIQFNIAVCDSIAIPTLFNDYSKFNENSPLYSSRVSYGIGYYDYYRSSTDYDIWETSVFNPTYYSLDNYTYNCFDVDYSKLILKKEKYDLINNRVSSHASSISGNNGKSDLLGFVKFNWYDYENYNVTLDDINNWFGSTNYYNMIFDVKMVDSNKHEYYSTVFGCNYINGFKFVNINFDKTAIINDRFYVSNEYVMSNIMNNQSLNKDMIFDSIYAVYECNGSTNIIDDVNLDNLLYSDLFINEIKVTFTLNKKMLEYTGDYDFNFVPSSFNRMLFCFDFNTPLTLSDKELYEYYYNQGVLSVDITKDNKTAYDNGFIDGKKYMNRLNNLDLSAVLFDIALIPFNTLKSLFGYELFGINILGLLTGLIGLLLGFWIIKKLIRR